MNFVTADSDISFNYAQAKSIVREKDFPFQKVNAKALADVICAVDFTKDYGGLTQTDIDQLTKGIKDTKDKRKELLKYFPPWLCNERKDKKARHEMVEMVNQYIGLFDIKLKL